MDYRVARGEIDHLTADDLSDLMACLMTLKVRRPSLADDIVFILETCLIHASESPWSVIHDEDLIALHRGDDDKPVLLFTKRAQ